MKAAKCSWTHHFCRGHWRFEVGHNDGAANDLGKCCSSDGVRKAHNPHEMVLRVGPWLSVSPYALSGARARALSLSLSLSLERTTSILAHTHTRTHSHIHPSTRRTRRTSPARMHRQNVGVETRANKATRQATSTPPLLPRTTACVLLCVYALASCCIESSARTLAQADKRVAIPQMEVEVVRARHLDLETHVLTDNRTAAPFRGLRSVVA